VVFSFNDLQAVVRTPRPRTLLGVRKGYRGRSGMYLPLLEALGLAELTHEARNNRMRAI
jgi:hypothetical protein